MTVTLYRDEFGLPRVRAGKADQPLAAYLETDVQENEALARELLRDLAAAEKAPAQSREIIGNAYVLTVTAGEVAISDLYDEDAATYRTGLEDFRRALTQWLAFIADS